MIEKSGIQSAVVQHHVNSALLQKAGQLGGALLYQLHMYLRVTDGKSTDEAGQYPGCKEAAATQHQITGFQVAPIVYVVGEFIFNGHDLLHGADVSLAAFGQGQGLGAPIEKRISHFSFNSFNIGT